MHGPAACRTLQCPAVAPRRRPSRRGRACRGRCRTRRPCSPRRLGAQLTASRGRTAVPRRPRISRRTRRLLCSTAGAPGAACRKSRSAAQSLPAHLAGLARTVAGQRPHAHRLLIAATLVLATLLNVGEGSAWLAAGCVTPISRSGGCCGLRAVDEQPAGPAGWVAPSSPPVRTKGRRRG